MKRRTETLARRHHGSMYFMVLAICVLVAILGIGAVLAARIQARAVSQTSDFDNARLYARSGIELGTYLANQANFRSIYTNGPWITGQPMGSGRFSITGINPNGPLNNSELDPVNLTTWGYQGIAVHKSQVTLAANPQPLPCLQNCATFGGSVSLAGSGNLTVGGDQPLFTNGSFTATAATLNVPVQYAGSLAINAGCSGTFTTKSSSPLALPPATAFDFYKAHGTPISLSSLSLSGGNYTLQNCVLGPASNPFGGTTNPQGIYVIDCGSLGASITVTNCRIVGTLVILSAGAGTNVQGAVNWSPAVSNYPALMVQCAAAGSLSLQYDSAVLSEGTLGVNFNPSSTPYNGISNSTMGDSYPSVIQGLIYCSGNVTTSTNHSTIKGLLIAGGALSSSSGNLDMTWGNASYKSPPPGFYLTPVLMQVSPGSFAQGVN